MEDTNPTINHTKDPKKEKIKIDEKVMKFYDRNYKILTLIPIIILLLSGVFLSSKYFTGEELIKKDSSLTGGISVTLFVDDIALTEELESSLNQKYEDITFRSLKEFATGKQFGVVIETNSEDLEGFKKEIEQTLGYGLTEGNSSIEFTGPLLSNSFFKQLIRSFVFAFLFIAVVVFLIFRAFIPSFIAVFSIFSNAVITLTILSMIDFRLSTAGIAAFLMLIGYSIDTDILLTTRVLKRRDKEFYLRMKDAAKTGLTMTIAGLIAVSLSYFFLISPILKEIFLILTIGLLVDIMNTWLFNASLLKLYIKKKEND